MHRSIKELLADSEIALQHEMQRQFKKAKRMKKEEVRRKEIEGTLPENIVKQRDRRTRKKIALTQEFFEELQKQKGIETHAH